MLAMWRMIKNPAIFDNKDEENSEDDAPWKLCKRQENEGGSLLEQAEETKWWIEQ